MASSGRVAVGTALAVVAVAVVGMAAASLLPKRSASPAPTTTPTPPPSPAGQIAGSADGRQLESGVSTSWPTTNLVDTGPADWTYNKPGWDYVGIVKDWRI